MSMQGLPGDQTWKLPCWFQKTSFSSGTDFPSGRLKTGKPAPSFLSFLKPYRISGVENCLSHHEWSWQGLKITDALQAVLGGPSAGATSCTGTPPSKLQNKGGTSCLISASTFSSAVGNVDTQATCGEVEDDLSCGSWWHRTWLCDRSYGEQEGTQPHAGVLLESPG